MPTLDALRTLAVLMVMSGHTAQRFYENGGADIGLHKLPPIRFGWSGVDLFFVLSGYLIGSQLWREVERTGSVSFPKFFFRRAMRIWPYYFAFMAFVALVRPPNEGKIGLQDLLFYSNYVDAGVSGGWSLSTEEQFYIAAPLLVMAIAWIVRRASPRAPLASQAPFHFAAIGVAAIATSIARSFVRHRAPAGDVDPQTLHTPFHLHNDGLLFGLAIALAFTLRPRWQERDDLSLRGWIAGAAMWAIAAILYVLDQRTFNFAALGLVYAGALVALVLDRTWVRRLLTQRIFRALSVLSFGMYLNHFVLVAILPAAWVPRTKQWPAALAFFGCYGAVIVASACVAMVTYVLIEHPFLMLRDRLLARFRAAA